MSIDEELKSELREIAQYLKNTVNLKILYDNKDKKWQLFLDAIKYLHDLSKDKLNITINIAKSCPMVKINNNILYMGLPMYEEFGAFIATIVYASDPAELPVKLPNKKYKLAVFSSSDCTYCAPTVLNANVFTIATNGYNVVVILDTIPKGLLEKFVDTYKNKIAYVPVIMRLEKDIFSGTVIHVGELAELDVLIEKLISSDRISQ